MGRFEDDNQQGIGYRIALTGLGAVIRILLLVLIVLLILAGARKLYALGYEAFSTGALTESEKDAVNVEVSITKDMSVSDIAKKLNDLGLIKMSEEAFVVEATAFGFTDKVIPGHYTLNSSMTPARMMEIMSTEVEEDDS